MKVKFFYRDGSNYKCTWIQEVEQEYWDDFVNQLDEEYDIEEYIDRELSSDPILEIYEFGLSMSDIPLIQEYGESDQDHPYVSIVDYGEHLED